MHFKFINSENLIASGFEIEIEQLSRKLELLKFPCSKETEQQYLSGIDNLVVNVIFVNKVEIKKLNRAFRSKNIDTDILSFNINEPDLLGELYICLDYVKANHLQYEPSFEKEVLRLFVHGTLHLCGYDHMVEFSQSSEEAMFVVQERLLAELVEKFDY